MTLPLSENEGLDLGMRVSTFVLRQIWHTPQAKTQVSTWTCEARLSCWRQRVAHPLSENAGLDLDMRGSTFVLEAKVAHPLSENAGLDLELRVSTFVLEAKMAHPLSETTILDFLHR